MNHVKTERLHFQSFSKEASHLFRFRTFSFALFLVILIIGFIAAITEMI